MSIFSDQNLNDAYLHESDANVRERILLIRRIRIEDKNVADVAKNELHRSRAWAYKWLKRYDVGLEDQPRNGGPPEGLEEKLKIIKEISEIGGMAGKRGNGHDLQEDIHNYNEVHIHQSIVAPRR